MTTNLLEISIHPHHISFPKKQTTLDSGYHSADELLYSSSPTTSISSRRSSFSSFSSFHTNNNRQSLPPSQRYTTLKSAHERIEFLEEQIKTRRQSNEMVVKGMTYQIDTFLKNYNKSSDPLLLSYSSTDSSLTPVVNILNELKNIVSQNNITIVQEEPTVKNQQQQQQHQQIIFSTQIIDNWIQSVTQHKSKQDLQNVSINNKYHKIIQDIQKLSKQHKLTKFQLRKKTQSEERYKLKLQQEIKQNKSIKQDKIEIEQLLDEIRNEMENMMEELHHIKLERDRYLEKSNRFELDLNQIKNNQNQEKDIIALQALLRESEIQIEQLEDDYQEQINNYISKIDTLKFQLKNAERSIAELSLINEVQKRQQQSIEMEQILRRTLAERDGELAKIKFQLEKNKIQANQIKLQQEKQLKLELDTRLEAIELNLKDNYKKETDTFLLHVSRQVREDAGKISELESELEVYHKQQEQHLEQSIHSQLKLKNLQSTLEISQKLTTDLEKKVKILEGEVLLLYGKNLELAQHLGELDL